MSESAEVSGIAIVGMAGRFPGAPDVETFWVYKGQYDARASPFYATFDFTGIGVEDRPIHLMHEFVLHFELALAWDSFDSMVSYRLSENNARWVPMLLLRLL